MFDKAKNNNSCHKSGFTLVEVLIGAVILLIVCLGVYGAFTSVIKTVRGARVKTDAMLLANEQIEIVRNLPYQDVGIIAGIPVGKIPREQTLVRGGNTFRLTASILNIDDPFDGTQGGEINDLAPADYKKMQIDIECVYCAEGVFPGQTIYTTIAPKNLETATGNGSLIVKVFDSNGDPVPGARVLIDNDQTASPITIDEVSNNEGILSVVDTPPSSISYEISVTKAGFSTDGTYSPTAGNPNPMVPPATVLGGQVTQLSFAIDALSHLKISTVNSTCQPLGGVELKVEGQKKIGQNPDVYKYSQTHTSDPSGEIDLLNLEWDTYKFSMATSGPRFISGSSLFTPMLVSPGSDQEIIITTVPPNPRSLLVSVRDAATGLPLSGAEVVVDSRTIETSQGYFNQTDWSGGNGQSLYDNETKFFDTDGSVEFSVAGELSLRTSLGQYLPAGELTSSIFDSGSTSTVYASLRWLPADQATSTGAESIRLQLASGNDPATTTWRFMGPDGTESSYYSVSNSALSSVHQGDRYIRYKLFLSTEDVSATPNISDISITYTAACTPPGQAFFSALPAGSQVITVTKTGYTTYSSTLDITDLWQSASILLEQQ